VSISNVHICFARYDEQKVEEDDCPFCKTKQLFFLAHEEWHGYTSVCLNCGHVWMEDGEYLVPSDEKRLMDNVHIYNKMAKKLKLLPKDSK